MDTLYKSFEETHLNALREEMEVLERSILSGSCGEHTRYMWETGQLQGLRLALRLFEELAQKYHNT